MEGRVTVWTLRSSKVALKTASPTPLAILFPIFWGCCWSAQPWGAPPGLRGGVWEWMQPCSCSEQLFGTAKSMSLSEAAWEWQSRQKCSLVLMKARRAGTVFSCGLLKNAGLGVKLKTEIGLTWKVTGAHFSFCRLPGTNCGGIVLWWGSRASICPLPKTLRLYVLP